MQTNVHHSILTHRTYIWGYIGSTVYLLHIHTYHAASLTRAHSSSRVRSSPLHWGYMVLYSTVSPRCFFSADDLRDRLDGCPLPCWRNEVTTLLPLPSGSSLSPASCRGRWRGEDEERQRDSGEDESLLDQPVFSMQVFRANTFCFFQVSSGWVGDKENESWKCDDVVLVCGLRSKSLRSLADSSRQSSLAKEADLFMREGGVRPAWRIRASSSMALCHPVGSRKLFPSCLSLSRCPTCKRWEVCSELTTLLGPGSVSIVSRSPWGCPSSCTSLSVTSKLTPSWRKACSSLSVCWILSSSWLPQASLIWASQSGPQPRFLPWELDSRLSSVSDSWTVTPSRIIRFELAWGRVCWFWLWSWFRLWDGVEVSRDDSNSWLVEVSDDIGIWLSVGWCVMIGIAPETWLIFTLEEHEGSGSLSVPEESSLWSSRCDPVCPSSSLDLAEKAVISPWVSLCSVECRGDWRGGCSVFGEHRGSLTGECSVLGECSGDRWEVAISISSLSFCSSCLVARRTEPAGHSHGSMEGGCVCEGGVKELCVSSEVSFSSWCSGWMSWSDMLGHGDGDGDEEGEGIGRQEAGWHMASISVTIWRTDIPLSLWRW